MSAAEPWLADIPADIDKMDVEYQRRHHIYAYCHETETGRCITWPELLKLLRSREAYMHTVTVPVTRACFAEELGNCKPEADEICRIGYHRIDGISWETEGMPREIVKLMIAFHAAAGEGPDEDGYGRSWGTGFAAWMDRQGHQLTLFQIFSR